MDEHDRPAWPEAVEAYLSASTLRARREAVERYPFLLSDEADEALAVPVADADAAQALAEMREVLRACREHGVEMAFDPTRYQLTLPADDPEVTRALTILLRSTDAESAVATVEEHPVLLAERASELLTALAARARFLGRDTDADVLESYRRGLDELRTSDDVISVEQALDLCWELAEAIRSDVEMSAWFRTHPKSMSSAFREALRRLLGGGALDAPYPFMGAGARFALRFLHVCEVAGRDTALTRLAEAGADYEGLQALAMVLHSERHPSDPVESFRVCREFLDHPARLFLTEEAHMALCAAASDRLQTAAMQGADLGLLDLRVRLGRAALDPPPADDGARAEFLAALGHALSARAEHTGDAEDLRSAAALYEQVLGLDRAGGERRASLLNNVGAGYRDLYHLADENEALDRAVDLFRQAMTLSPTTLHLGNLAVSLSDRFRRSGDAADLQEALATFERVVTTAAASDADLPRVLADYASCLLQRYDREESAADLDRALDLSERAVALRPLGSVGVYCRVELAEALGRRMEVSGDMADYDRAIGLLEEARASLPPGSALGDRAALRHVVLQGMWWGSHQTGENLAALVSTLRSSLSSVRDGSDIHRQLTQLAVGFEPPHAEWTGDPADLSRAISLLETYVPAEETLPGMTEPQDPAERTRTLGRLLVRRGAATSSLPDVDRGIELAAAAGDGLRVQAFGHTERFMITLDAADLERALADLGPLAGAPADSGFDASELAERIVAVAGRRHRLSDGRDIVDVATEYLRARRMAGAEPAALLSDLLDLRFQTYGDVRDLHSAVDAMDQGLRALSPGEPGYGMMLIRAGGRWRELYTFLGEPGAFTRALECLTQAVEKAEDDASLHPSAYNTLGTVLRARYNFTGDLGHLDQAITAYERSLDGWGEDRSVTWAIGVSNLANALRASYDSTGEPERLDRSIDLHEQAVAVFPADHPDLRPRLANLGNAYLSRFQANGAVTDLDRAEELRLQVLDILSANSPLRAEMTASLSDIALMRFDLTGDPAHLRTAVELGRKATSLAPAGTPAERHVRFRLAESLVYEHRRTARESTKREAVGILRELSADGDAADHAMRLGASRLWARWAADRGAWQEASEAFRTWTKTSGDLVRLQVSRGLRTRIVGRSADLAPAAAYSLTRVGDLEAAVMAVETARAVSVSETLELGSADVRWLAEHGLEQLAERFTTAVARWLSASGDGLDRGLAGGAGTVNFSDHDTAVRAARAEVDALIEEIREASGQTGFLRPPTFADVASASTDPIVYLVASEYGGVALIVEGSRTRSLDLPALTSRQVQDWLVLSRQDGTLNWWSRLERVTGELWDAAFGPLADLLGEGPVTLVPSGRLELLPLNAAWTRTPDGRRRYAIDGLTLRTVPNARVLNATRARAERAGETSLLAIVDPQPVSAAPLTGAAAEVAGAAAWFTDRVVLSGRQASADKVLALLQSYDVVHFACHGSADPSDPLNSSLTLADDRLLTLRDLLDIRDGEAAPVRLVVLSACETGVVGPAAPSEVIGLSSGLLEAGAAGAVVSQWRVPDLSTALLMMRFYSEWKAGGFDPAAALCAAQRWLRDTTNAEKADHFRPGGPSGLAPETTRPLWRRLIRLEPEHRGFAHPVHWAGFVFVGS
ncbi:CHAT domain-containing protein [Streptomyces sp. NPDC088763]|uniref:CHAT domain-containing protein n=2 Tax=unclassified Streptomyces TaxID=2593676 RepID=UPI0037F206B0